MCVIEVHATLHILSKHDDPRLVDILPRKYPRQSYGWRLGPVSLMQDATDRWNLEVTFALPSTRRNPFDLLI